MKKFLYSLFSDDKSVSSKRVFGAIGFVTMLIKVFQVNDSTIIISTLGICAGLLGLETVMNAFIKPAVTPQTPPEI